MRYYVFFSDQLPLIILRHWLFYYCFYGLFVVTLLLLSFESCPEGIGHGWYCCDTVLYG